MNFKAMMTDPNYILQENLRDTDRLLEAINTRLDDYRSKAREETAGWGDNGDVGHVREGLLAIAEFLGCDQ